MIKNSIYNKISELLTKTNISDIAYIVLGKVEKENLENSEFKDLGLGDKKQIKTAPSSIWDHHAPTLVGLEIRFSDLESEFRPVSADEENERYEKLA